MTLFTLKEIQNDIDRTKHLIEVGKDAVYHAVLNGNFEKAKATAEQVEDLKKKLKEFIDQLVDLKIEI